ncbi:sodium-independent sulfate anion transporter-like isoform X1 [Rhopalosiphum maidis]|uniref:sodium-independent sulfate anion transporter-like isoform X1 n=2 Tax=Rhopalosiphum maidis TaxID=43146 RepID=UPI000F00C47A|nr:sodium-independent sulfate anion transporter-like isoform X1 [Rhopalosiphum maidis]XP_026818891.1 sodium-independent sulfate anion transporter-like isoform X1 [Rhopalosiphum maidis]XP_026818899.1 sodium-independent sulfate anion transporter-like isoform X1 [Rhopalosiphum maidis]XP_026818906.1 sodium-independent sulfate anion transporter-like isoform X1 [Rhopalosiphum maidis]
MTITNDDNDRHQNRCEKMEVNENIRSQYTIGSNDFILVDEVGERPKKNVKEKLHEFSSCLNSNSKTVFTYKTITKRLPILQWWPTYSSADCIGDLLAGITVGLTLIPQSMAYSALAGLPPQQGLYGSFIGSLMYVFLGTCKEVPMGPTAIISLMTYNTLHGLGPVYGTLLCFLTGVIQLIMGLVGLGFLIDFISGPVNSGFTSAVAILIVASQIKDLIGVKAAGTTLVDMIISISKDISHYQLGDTWLGIICIVVILLLRRMALCQIGPKDVKEQTMFHKIMNRSMWLIGTFRNSIVVIVSSYVGYVYITSTGHDVTSNEIPPIPFKVVGKIPSGLPEFDLPKFSIARDNGTTIGFFEMVSNIGSGVIVLPIIALIETISICKTFADGKPVDATQELLATGLCNIGNSFFHAYPGTGSFSRSAVNAASGVRTPMEGLYAGILVIFALLFCTPYLYYIPKAALAAIIIAAVIFMVEVRVVRPIYRSKKSDLIPGLATFFACLVLPLEIGVLIGIGLNLVSILYHAARPKLLIEVHKTRDGINYLMVTPDRCLVFPSVDYVRNLVMKQSLKRELPVVIDCSHIYGADFTAAKVIEMLTQDFSKRGQALFFYNLKPSVVAVFEGVQPKGFITYYHRHDLDQLFQRWKQQRQQIEHASAE